MFLLAPLFMPGSPAAAEGSRLPSTHILQQPAAPQSPSAATWYDGSISYSVITNCVSIIQGLPYTENGIGAYTGFAADPNLAQPGVGQVYYAHIVIYGLGNSCSGQRAYIDLQLPANTSLAISLAAPVVCLADGVQITPASDCPQTLPASTLNPGGYQILSSDTAHARTWPVPQGHNWEFQIPLVSSTTLSNVTMQANIWALDGNSSPWLRPSEGVYVFSSTPTIIYLSPSTLITPSPSPNYKSQAYLYAFNLGGTAYFELGTSASYGAVTDAVPITASGTAWYVWDDWTPFPLAANTTYHWRLRFAASNSQTYYGADQTFTTLPDGQATVGGGTPASCTPAAFDSALATPGLKQIAFNCGQAPVTISLSGGKTIAASLTIDGGNRVTLSGAGSFRHFDVQAGATLTLQNLTLTGGAVTGCGGAVHIQAGATLNTSVVFMTGNHANGNGGAVCIESSGLATLDRSQFTNNSAGADGGAIYNLGLAEFMWSDVSANSAQNNGGGAWNSGTIGFTTSLIANNTLPTGTLARGTQEGGGLYNVGNADLSTSSVAGNTASFSAGIYNLNASLTLNNVTIAKNTATAGGKIFFTSAQAGGLDSNGTGGSSVRNTLIADNLPGNCGQSPTRTVTTLGNNLDSAAQCLFTAPTDLSNTNPFLGTLANNGGSTRTLKLGLGSPAIDAADNVYCGMFDQRGFSGPSTPGNALQRQLDGNRDHLAVCDIGAYEYRPQIFLPAVNR
jgi:hypothetical protein